MFDPTIPAPGEETIPPLDEPDRITPEEAEASVGCWFDEANHGHYIGQTVVREALSRGWHDAEEDRIRAMADAYPDLAEEDQDVWNEVVNDAERWLDEVVAPAGYGFGFHDGSFFFQPDYWWCEGEEGGYCDDPDHPHYLEAAANMARRYAAHG